MQAIRISKNNILVATEVHPEDSNAIVLANIRDPVSWIFIYDRSGSMDTHIQALCEEMKAQIHKLPPGDTISLVWFSGTGQKGTILKGVKIPQDENDPVFSSIDVAIDLNNRTIGTTCFSETLAELSQHVQDLKSLTPKVACVFFTDGQPVVSNYSAEISAIHAAIKTVSSHLCSTLLIGYGDSYNKELMADMASRFNGSLIHNEDIREFGISVANYVTDGQITNLDTVSVPADVIMCFSLRKGGITLHTIENFTVRTAASTLYYIVAGSYGDRYVSNLVVDILNSETLLKGCYGAAIALIQKGKSDVALDFLNAIGDKAAMTLVMNAFTNSEIGSCEKQLQMLIDDASKRFAAGRDTNFIPDEHAQCLVDVLYVLMDDSEARFLPRHPQFEYKKITKTKPNATGVPHFSADNSVAVPFRNLVWNKTKLNLSIGVRIPGTVELNDINDVDSVSIGLQKIFATSIYRNYTIIKDGKLNVKFLPIHCGVTTVDYLVMTGLIKAEDKHSNDGIYTLDLTKVPLMNRAMAKETSAKNMAILALMELRAKCHQKVLNNLLSVEDDEANDVTAGKNISNYTEIQAAFLEANGIKPQDSSFNPPAAKRIEGTPEEVSDYYISRSFSIKIAGASSLPKVSDVISKVNGQKALNIPGKFMAQAIASAGRPLVSSVLQTMLATTKKELHDLSKRIQSTKFAILLGNKWFDEFTSRDDCSVNIAEMVDGIEVNTSVSFILSEEKVLID